MGFIYHIEGPLHMSDKSKKYVGLTTRTLVHRFDQHKASYVAHEKRSKVGALLYMAMEEYGFDNFKMTMIEECNITILGDREIYWIEELSTITPGGYNIREGGSFHNHSDETRHLISQIKKNNESKHLPDYISYNIRDDNPKNVRHGYNVFHVPSNKRKRIEVPIDQELTDDMLDMAIAYLQEFIDNYNNPKLILSRPSIIPPTSFKRNVKSIGLPMFINYYEGKTNGVITNHGYRVQHTPSNIRRYVTTKINKPITDEMLEKAKYILADIIDKYEKSLLKDLENLKL